jgi:hypothetical protein
MAYSAPIKMPMNKRDGLQNFVQMVINRIEAGDAQSALLTAVDLLEDLRCGIYDDAMADAKGHSRLVQELEAKHQADIITSAQHGYERGVADEKARMSKALGLIAA